MALWVRLLCILASVALTQTNQCFPTSPDAGPGRHFYFNGNSLPIVIETSNRASQRMLSHVVKILLHEILGYEKVELKTDYNSMNATEILNRLSGCAPAAEGCHVSESIIPATMVNLEIWMPSGFNMEPWVNNELIVDAGPLGPSGRFGWFMPTSDVESSWLHDQSIIDHWRALKMSTVTNRFSLHDEDQFLRDFLTHDTPEENNALCTSEYCQDGILYGHKCTPKKKCAVLLSSYPELDEGILKQQVENLGLDVSIAWIGSHLPSFVSDRTNKALPSLFFDWTPNMLTALGNYTRVKFPLCKSNHLHPNNCDFEINQLSKAVWMRMQTHTPEAHHLISQLHLTQEQYEDMLRVYHVISPAGRTEASYEQAACEWVRRNKRIWQDWIPKNLSNKTRIYLGGMFPITGRFVRQPGIVPGAQMALEYVNKDPNILPDYELVMVFQDTQCMADIAMKQFMYLIVNDTHPVAGILGPGCSETAEPVAAVSKHFNTIIVSYSAESVALGDRQTYPLFFRTVPQKNQYGIVYMDIFHTFGWKQVALLAEDGQEFPEYHSFLEDHFLAAGMSVVYQRKMPRQATPEDAVKYIEGIKKRDARIIILTSFGSSARAVICEAYRQKMTALDGYQWFLPAWFTKQWWDTDYFNKVSNSNFGGYMAEHVPCSTRQMFKAIQGHIYLQSAYFGADDLTIAGNVTVKHWNEIYTQRLKRLASQVQQHIEKEAYASYAYDAVWVYAYALDRLLKEDPSALESLHTDDTTQRFMYNLANTNFVGVSGPVQFDGADRTGIINIFQSMGNSSNLIGQYLPNRNVSDRIQLNESQIMWLSGKKPTDGSQATKVCSVEAFRAFLGVDCGKAIAIANIMGVGPFAIIMVIGLIVVKKRYESKVKATRERMQELGLLSDTSWLSLDQWEVSREHVVLNRKLGEGAFGTVYGGEALIEETWVAVAVKTLKIGSNAEEKLDFLSEAEMMKRFDHENIVKLMGVCTRGEPSYTIMEFMLHGDLKTFLLARRQLVGQDTKEAEDVTPEALTRMALDVAHGLKYLTDLKYVHRDLACRNCLVHVSKHVKIGDFGMTRPMYDSDYYRFNKRGMLPVRWMAPESLVDGIFSPSSDIWSFGVLLFEIVTFGSFPYQGLSNKQVLEHVKRGNCISLPAHYHRQLKEMLQSCWLYEPMDRPSVDVMIDLCRNNPRLLMPCLDAPLSSVMMGDNEPVEMPIHQNRQSISSGRLRGTFRASGDHSHLHRSLSQEGKFIMQSPTSFSSTDPFSILGPVNINHNGTLPYTPLDSEHVVAGDLQTDVMSGSISDGEMDSGGCQENHITKGPGCQQEPSSPDSPLPMRYAPVSTNDCIDKHCHGDHPKEFWQNMNGTSAL